MQDLLAYLQSPATLATLSFLLVATVRKRFPKLDGMLLVLASALVAGVALSAAAAGLSLLVGVAIASWPTVLGSGAACGALAFLGANGVQWIASKVPAPLRGAALLLLEQACELLRAKSEAGKLVYTVDVDSGDALAKLEALQAAAEKVQAALPQEPKP